MTYTSKSTKNNIRNLFTSPEMEPECSIIFVFFLRNAYVNQNKLQMYRSRQARMENVYIGHKMTFG